jgi:hypothetical protein
LTAAFDVQDRDRTIQDSPEKSSYSSNGAAKSDAIDPEFAELPAAEFVVVTTPLSVFTLFDPVQHAASCLRRRSARVAE